MSADTKPSEARSLRVLWTLLQLACSLATLEGSCWDSGVGGTLLLPWGLEEQELSRVQAWAASVPQDPKEAPRDVLLSSLLAVSAAQTGAHTVMAKTQLPGVGSCLYHKDSSNN